MWIRQLASSELDRIAPLRALLWPGSSIAELRAILAARPEYLVLVALDDEETAGFVEISLRREDDNGFKMPTVAFVEGICVAPSHRRKGVARALVAKAMEWGRARGIHEFASEALLANGASHAFHRALGFAETERVVCFRRAVRMPA